MTTLKDKTVITRKDSVCSACLRRFPKGTEMQIQTSIIDGDLSDWRSCMTCTELLNKHRADFDNGDGICWESCVHDTLNEGQTPEDLLASYNPTTPALKLEKE